MNKNREAIRQVKRDKKVMGFIDKINKYLKKIEAPIELHCWRDRDTYYQVDVFKNDMLIVSFGFDYSKLK